MKRGALASVVAGAALLSGCGAGEEDGSGRIASRTLTIYSSLPSHGASAHAGRSVLAGEQRALEQAGSRAGGRRVRLVRMSSTRPGDQVWDPGMVNSNAERAGEDPSAIAYLGELDLGGSAVSLPVTNRAGLLQVSPADGLTSLTRTPPGRPRAGPERYYPHRLRSFLRLVPSDLVLADRLVSLLRRRGLERTALVHGDGIAERELAAVLASRLRDAGIPLAFVEPLRDVGSVSGLVERLDASRPDSIVQVGAAGPATAALLTALGRRLPAVPVLGATGLTVPGLIGDPAPRDIRALTPIVPTEAQPARGRRLLRTLQRERGTAVGPEALLGYAAMQLVLGAIDRAGPDRRAVVKDVLTPGTRQSVFGPISIRRSGDISGPLALLRLSGGRASVERLLH